MAKALAQADKVRADAETQAKELLSNARRNADRVVAEAREHAEKQIGDALTESERERTTAARQVEDLNRQRESITTYLDELRNLLGHDPDRAALERARRAEAAFKKEQTKPVGHPQRRGRRRQARAPGTARPSPVRRPCPAAAAADRRRRRHRRAPRQRRPSEQA